MCDFFSFIQDAKGNIYYFNVEQCKQIYKNHVVAVDGKKTDGISNPDSHDAIAQAFIAVTGRVNPGDMVNKYEIEFSAEGPILERDTISIPKSMEKNGLVDQARRWMHAFSQSREFADICRYTMHRKKRAQWYLETRMRAANMLSLNTSNLTPKDVDDIISICPDRLVKFHNKVSAISVKAQVHLISRGLHKNRHLSKFITEDGIFDYFKSKAGRRDLTRDMVTNSLVDRIAATSGRVAYYFLRSIAEIPGMTAVVMKLLHKVSPADMLFLQHGVNSKVARAVLTYRVRYGDMNSLIKKLDAEDAAACLRIIKKDNIKVSRDKRLVLHAIAGKAIAELNR